KLLQQEQWAYLSTHPSKRLTFFCYDDDDDDYNSAITPFLSTEEPVDSLISSIDDDSFSIDKIDYVEVSPHDFELVSLEAAEIVIQKVEEIEDDNLQISSGSTTTYSDISLSEYDSFIFEEFVDELAHIISPPNDDDSLHEENIEYVEASPHDSELVSLEAAEIVIPEEEEIEDDNLREKLLNVHLLIANIEVLKDNPTPSSEHLTKSSSTSLNSFLEETNTFYNYLPEFGNFYFDLGEISSGSTTTHSDISLPDYEAFYFDDDHIKEISSGSPTTQSDISLSEYDSFIFNFTHEEFIDELAHFISPPEYDCFYFRNLPDPGELMSVLNSGIRENLSTTLVALPIEDDHSPLLTYVVKENQEKDKIESKPDKNGKRGEAEKSLKQLRCIKEEKPKKTQKEWSKTHTRSKSYSNFKRKKKRKGHK
nr:hypothetical protein [Tanacetum cinerariifolium]